MATSNRYSILSIISFALLLLLLPAPLQAEPGLISDSSTFVDLKRKAKVDNYHRVENLLINKLEQAVTQATKGKAVKPPSFTEAEVLHLNGVYYVCSLKRGSCPSVLDGLMEIEFLSALYKQKRDTKCPQMRKFWQLWIKNDFEKKQGYELNTGQIKQKQHFDTYERPKYLRCSDTIEGRLKQNSKDYRSYLHESIQLSDNPIKRLYKLTKEIKKKIPNVFQYSRK